MTLQVFPRHPRIPFVYRVKGSWQPHAVVAHYNRFTDAELCAESYRAAAWLGANGRAHATDEGRNIVFDAAFTFGPITREEHEWLTVNRFATLPHWDSEKNT